MKTNIIKVIFLRGGNPQGRAYTYYTPEEVEVNDTVELMSSQGVVQGVVVQINVPEVEIEPFKDKAKTIIGKVKIKEETK